MSKAVGAPLTDSSLMPSDGEWYFLSARVGRSDQIGTWAAAGVSSALLDPAKRTDSDIENFVHLTLPADDVARGLDTAELFDAPASADYLTYEGAQASRRCVEG